MNAIGCRPDVCKVEKHECIICKTEAQVQVYGAIGRCDLDLFNVMHPWMQFYSIIQYHAHRDKGVLLSNSKTILNR